MAKKCVRDGIRRCSSCGKRILDFGFVDDSPIYKLMSESGMCYECAYWKDFIENKPDNLEIIEGKCYHFLREQYKTPMMTLGMEGKMRYILRRNGDVAKSNDVWLINEVPLKYRDQLPNTAWWIKSRAYYKLERWDFKCRSKACMDRYHCYRFDYKNELGKEPYNFPPLDWITGDEHCRDFVNLLDIRGYDRYYDINDILSK